MYIYVRSVKKWNGKIRELKLLNFCRAFFHRRTASFSLGKFADTFSFTT